MRYEKNCEGIRAANYANNRPVEHYNTNSPSMILGIGITQHTTKSVRCCN